MPPRWQLSAYTTAVPCTVCVSYALSAGRTVVPSDASSVAHTCPVSVAHPHTLDVTHAGPRSYAVAYACAFTRAIRDA